MKGGSVNYFEKIEAHHRQMEADGYTPYHCGRCDKTIWRKPIEDWFFCDDCTTEMNAEDEANGIKERTK
jgi:ribosomal protein L37AE/L43A